MSRTALLLLAVVLVTGSALPTSAQAPSPEGTLLIPDPGGPITVNCAASGNDLTMTATFPFALSSYLTPQMPVLSLVVYFDTDKNAQTGFAQAEDARRGADYSVDLTLRRPSGEAQAPAEEVTVVQHKAESSFGTLVPAKTAVKIDGNKVVVSVPLSAMKLRKGQAIRIAAQSSAAAYVDQAVTLK